MAVLRQGTVISATVEQSLGNCLLISFKHRSRTFRGVLFDERNSMVPRATANKQNNDHNLMVNKSSLPLGTAIVSPSKQPYSSLRNRIYYNTNTKRSGSSNSRSTSSKNVEGKSNSGGKTENVDQVSLGSEVSVNCSSIPAQKNIGTEDDSGLELRQSSRLLRQKNQNQMEKGTALKRKADTELVGSKPAKSRSNMQASNAFVVSKGNGSTTQKKDSSNNSSGVKVDTNSSDLDNSVVQPEKLEKSECDEVELPNISSNDDSSDHEYSTLNSIKQNIFPLDHSNNDSTVFNNDHTDNQSISNEENKSIGEEHDGVTEFFGRLGLGRTMSVDKDDASIFTDSGTSSSASEHFFEQQDERKDELFHDNELENNSDLIVKEDTVNSIASFSPSKKSARISAKRAILEQNMASCNDENTIWSIWGGSPIKHKIKMSSSEDGLQDGMQRNPDCVNMSPDSLSSSELSQEPVTENPQATTNKFKGPRIKQTPVRVKKVASAVVQPEKQVSVGNIVWGKVHGHPWWPGRVLAVSGIIGEGNEVTQHAHVTWFGSNTSSIMPVNELQHFIANFSRRHKKAKRGCYRKAVKQAQDMLEIMGEI